MLRHVVCYNLDMDFKKVKITTYVPLDSADNVRSVLGMAGAGTIGEYSFCSYSVVGRGRFMPSENANPNIGKSGTLEVVGEERIEVVCDRTNAKMVIESLKLAHPYEEVAFDVTPLLDIDNL
jgi:hypothetical protein